MRLRRLTALHVRRCVRPGNINVAARVCARRAVVIQSTLTVRPSVRPRSARGALHRANCLPRLLATLARLALAPHGTARHRECAVHTVPTRSISKPSSSSLVFSTLLYSTAVASLGGGANRPG